MEEIKIQSKAKAKDEASVSGASSLVSRGNSNLNRLPGLHGESARGGFIQLRIQLTKTHAYDTSIYDFGSITHENAEILL